MRRTLLAVLLLLPLSAVADFRAGLDAAKRGDFATALTEWRPLAEQGEAKPNNTLGITYATGQGVPQDYVEAVRWIEKAAEQGTRLCPLQTGLNVRSR